MTLYELRSHFVESLIDKYPKTEIQSFFNLLAEDYLGFSKIDIALGLKSEISKEKVQLFKKSIVNLKKYEPIQYILGKTDFFGFIIKVNQAVLIPRPETEELVEWVINDFRGTKNLNILDIGTGSGCIAIALAKNLTPSNVDAIDVSTEALQIAKQNSLDYATSINFIQQDILKSTQLEKRYHIIISNPPYVTEKEKPNIKPNVIENEPHTALFVKNDNPLIFYDKIADLALIYLKTSGALYFEINQYLFAETKELLIQKGFKNVILKKDIYQNYRMIKATL
ncbi:MAG: peptide chain release factor N(5)-glutamine methyltransferase [Lutibacter sp.]